MNGKLRVTRTIMRAVALLSLIVLAGCGKDSSGPSFPNLAGNWTYNLSILTEAGLSCSSFGTTMVLTHSSSTLFSGTYSGGTLTCTASGSSPHSTPIGNGTVAGIVGATGYDGGIHPLSVGFVMDTLDWHNNGAVSGSSMSGTAHVFISDGTNNYWVYGNFSAARQ